MIEAWENARVMSLWPKKSKIVLLSAVSLLAICIVSFLLYKAKVIHVGNIYWVDCGQSNGTRTSMIIHRWRVLLKAEIATMGYYPYLYVVFVSTDEPCAEKSGRYAKIDVRNGSMQIVDGGEVAHFGNKHRLHFQNHRQVRKVGNVFWQDYE